MTDLSKKIGVLLFLLVIVAGVYLIRNDKARQDLLLKLGLAASKDFEIPQDIKIDLSDIDIDSLAVEKVDFEDASDSKEAQEPEKLENRAAEDLAEPVAVNKEMSLQEIEQGVEEIAKQVDKIKKQVDILIAMNEIQKEIKDLASQAEELEIQDVEVECFDCNSLTSI